MPVFPKRRFQHGAMPADAMRARIGDSEARLPPHLPRDLRLIQFGRLLITKTRRTRSILYEETFVTIRVFVMSRRG